MRRPGRGCAQAGAVAHGGPIVGARTSSAWPMVRVRTSAGPVSRPALGSNLSRTPMFQVPSRGWPRLAWPPQDIARSTSSTESGTDPPRHVQGTMQPARLLHASQLRGAVSWCPASRASARPTCIHPDSHPQATLFTPAHPLASSPATCH